MVFIYYLLFRTHYLLSITTTARTLGTARLRLNYGAQVPPKLDKARTHLVYK